MHLPLLFSGSSPGTANNFCSDTSEFSRCLQFLDRNRHAAARIQISFSGAPLATLFEHILNIYTSGRSFIFATLKTVNEAFLDPFSTSFFLLLLGVLLSFLYTVFIQNVLLVGEARFFLEARTYQQTTISKLFFLYKVNFFSHPAWIMTCRCVFQTSGT